MNNSTKPQSNTINPQNNNKNVENFIKSTTTGIRFVKGKYDYIKFLINNTPIQIKILNIIIPLGLCYIFTYIYFNLALSIFFAILTFFVGTLMSKMISLIFIILYIIVIVNIVRARAVSIGKPIIQTDIVGSGSPYNCMANSLTVQNSSLPQDLNGGYFTYSFWLYINNTTNNSANNLSTTATSSWNNYRYNEWKSIFYRGNAIDSSGDLSSLVQFPGFWLTPVLNNMVIVFQNGSYVERLEIIDVPFNTWTNFSVVVEAKSVSVYINGLLDRTLNLYQSVTIMNGYNLYLTSDIMTSTNQSQSGFAGNLAELIFYNYALTSLDIYNSYVYYKKIINSYQNKINSSINYNKGSLITNSDYQT
jgi:hypothetical protein